MAPRIRAKSALARDIDETEALLSQQRSQATNKARKSTPAPPAPPTPPAPLGQETQVAAVALGLLARGQPIEIGDSEEIALGVAPSDEGELTASEDSDDLNRDFLEGVEAIAPPSAQVDASASSPAASPISHRPRVKLIVKPSKYTNLAAQIVGEATKQKSKPAKRARAISTMQSTEDEDNDVPVEFEDIGPELILTLTAIDLEILAEGRIEKQAQPFRAECFTRLEFDFDDWIKRMTERAGRDAHRSGFEAALINTTAVLSCKGKGFTKINLTVGDASDWNKALERVDNWATAGAKGTSIRLTAKFVPYLAVDTEVDSDSFDGGEGSEGSTPMPKRANKRSIPSQTPVASQHHTVTTRALAKEPMKTAIAKQVKNWVPELQARYECNLSNYGHSALPCLPSGETREHVKLTHEQLGDWSNCINDKHSKATLDRPPKALRRLCDEAAKQKIAARGNHSVSKKNKRRHSRSRSRSRERGYAQQQGFPQFMYPPYMAPQFGYPGAYAAPYPLPPIQAIPSNPIRAPPDKASAVDEFISWLQERGDFPTLALEAAGSILDQNLLKVAQLPKMTTIELYSLGIPMGIAIEMIAQAKAFWRRGREQPRLQ